MDRGAGKRKENEERRGQMGGEKVEGSSHG